ncbi:MAG: S8 family serine peptidase, partial [Oscillospiraceae bacterium]|nr:S8 family serine peptidase [Oscillospiraceae bacterium]
MNKQWYKRILSVQTALMLICSIPVGNGIPAGAAAQNGTPAQEVVTAAAESCAPVNVIVTLEADALLPGFTAEQLVTPEAAAESAAIAAAQDAVIAQLTEWYPETEVSHRYNVLTNAFACTLPENLLDDAAALPAVRSVARSYQVHTVREAASEEDVSNAMQFQSQTGCRGDGQVIAIIDSELDLEHPMFAPLADDVETKLTQEQVEAISDNIGFNVQIGTEYIWHSSKVPFAANYEDQIPMNVRDASEYAYHGTHVAGIAAGNVYEDAEGRTLSGIAPNAQIVFMAMQYISDVTDFIGALEDAVKLQADAINMSMGYCTEAPGKDDPFRDAVNTAEAAGITICISAGNSADGTLVSPRQTADNPDVSTMNVLVQDGTHALAVASADNPSEFDQHAMLLGEQKIGYSAYVTSLSTSDAPKLLSDTLKEASYEYEYCGIGDLSDFEGKDLTGKLALVDRGVLSFTEKAVHAMQVGAVGVIIIQNRPDEYFTPVSNAEIPVGIVSIENGALLKNAEDGKISFTDELVTVSLPADVSYYTSYGVHNSLELRPDIMGVGGYVESAAYHNSTSVQSGTSMASPYIAGCAMLLNEYLQKH